VTFYHYAEVSHNFHKLLEIPMKMAWQVLKKKKERNRSSFQGRSLYFIYLFVCLFVFYFIFYLAENDPSSKVSHLVALTHLSAMKYRNWLPKCCCLCWSNSISSCFTRSQGKKNCLMNCASSMIYFWQLFILLILVPK